MWCAVTGKQSSGWWQWLCFLTVPRCWLFYYNGMTPLEVFCSWCIIQYKCIITWLHFSLLTLVLLHCGLQDSDVCPELLRSGFGVWGPLVTFRDHQLHIESLETWFGDFPALILLIINSWARSDVHKLGNSQSVLDSSSAGLDLMTPEGHSTFIKSVY